MKTNRLLRWLFQRSKPTTISPAMSAYLSMERRRATIEPDLDIWEQPTAPMKRLDARTPAYEYGFYAGETVAVVTEDKYKTRKIPVLK